MIARLEGSDAAPSTIILSEPVLMKRETDSRLIKATANSDLLAEDKEERDKHKEL